MKLPVAIRASEIAQKIGAELHGPDVLIEGINEINRVGPGDLTFADHPKFYERALNSQGAAALLDRMPDSEEASSNLGQKLENKSILIHAKAFDAFNQLLKSYRPFQPSLQQIADSASIGKGSIIEVGAVVGENVTIGKDCIIHANVVIYDNSVIGDRVEIHANSVIGSHAFYFKTHAPRRYEKLNPSGRVVIGDDVEIGANCTIDKGGTADTIIGRGSKLDNLIHIGHGVQIGEDCLFAAQVGVAGKTIIGDRVQLWGQVGVSKVLTIGDEAVVYAQSGVKDDLAGHATYMGSPARPARPYMRELAAIRHLPEMWKALRSKLK